MDPSSFAQLPEPAAASASVRALWHDAHDDWQRAHALVQDDPGRDAARVHAYLHRKEGDLENARYWYARTGHAVFAGSLEEEWASLIESLA